MKTYVIQSGKRYLIVKRKQPTTWTEDKALATRLTTVEALVLVKGFVRHAKVIEVIE